MIECTCDLHVQSQGVLKPGGQLLDSECLKVQLKPLEVDDEVGRQRAQGHANARLSALSHAANVPAAGHREGVGDRGT